MKDRSDSSFGLLCFLGGAIVTLLWLLISNIKAVSNPSAFDWVAALGAIGSVLAAASAVYIAHRTWDRENQRNKEITNKRRNGILLVMRQPIKELLAGLEREKLLYHILGISANSHKIDDFLGAYKSHLDSMGVQLASMRKHFEIDYISISDYLDSNELERLDNVRVYLSMWPQKIQLVHIGIDSAREILPYPQFAKEQIEKLEVECRSIAFDLKSLLRSLGAQN